MEWKPNAGWTDSQTWVKLNAPIHTGEGMKNVISSDVMNVLVVFFRDKKENKGCLTCSTIFQ